MSIKENIQAELQKFMQVEDENRQKVVRGSSQFFKPTSGTSIVRILPLLYNKEHFVTYAKEHWVTKEDPIKGQAQQKVTCLTPIGSSNIKTCPLCLACSLIIRMLESGNLLEEDSKYAEGLVYRISDREPQKLAPAQFVWYMNVLELGTKEVLTWGCSQVSIQKALQEVLLAWPDFFKLQGGNNLQIQRQKNKYTVMPYPVSNIEQSVTINDLSKFSEPTMSAQEMVEIVDQWIDLGEGWYNG